MRPNVFTYEDFRHYLRDLYEHLKIEKKQFSFRFFANAAGFRSTNFLKLVMEGKRNLSLSSIEKFARGLKLTEPEAGFFFDLVQMNQAEDETVRASYVERLRRARELQKIRPLSEEELSYYTHWYFVPIREMLSLPTFNPNPEWIARKLRPSILSIEAKRALEELEKLGLIAKDAQGKWQQAEGFLSTPKEVTSSLIAQFHRHMIAKGSESIDRFAKQGREISSITLPLSAASFQQIKMLLRQFQNQILEVAMQDKEPTAVFQVNFQAFPLTTVPDLTKKD